MGKKDDVSSLGKSIIKDRKSSHKKHGISSKLHTTDLNDGYDWSCLQSMTDQNQLDEFLLTAEITGTEFAAEKLSVTFVSPTTTAALNAAQDAAKVAQLREMYEGIVRIPRRPVWDSTTSAEELAQREADSFMDWRRQLAEIQQLEDVTLTPFEKNLEIWRQLWRVIERSDVVVQTVDARNPLLFRCEDLERYVVEVNPAKINVLLMNKADLLTVEQRIHWARYLNSINLPAAFFSALQESTKTEEDDDLECVPLQDTLKQKFENGELLTRVELLEFLKNLTATTSDKTTIGLVGYPNVGKSSTINALVARKQTSVSMTPGKTKHFQTLLISPELCVCDCPGLVLPSFIASRAELIVNGILPIDQMRDPMPPVALISSRFPRHAWAIVYGVVLPEVREGEATDRPPNAEELLVAYGYMRGFMTQRGMPDSSRSARYILKDYISGKLLHCHAPPSVVQEDYHTFLKDSEARSAPASLPQQQAKIYEATGAGHENLDEMFFRKVYMQAHKKGIQASAGRSSRVEAEAVNSQSDVAGNNKPWKKHHNKNKREKLRRVYSDLDY